MNEKIIDRGKQRVGLNSEITHCKQSFQAENIIYAKSKVKKAGKTETCPFGLKSQESHSNGLDPRNQITVSKM